MRSTFRVSGRVQGVGFRFFVIQAAKKFVLTGWVRNCSNGDVECEAQGSEKAIKEFRTDLENGHPWARVDKIYQESIPDRPGEKLFEIQY